MKIKKIAIIVLSALVLYALAGFVLIPYVAKKKSVELIESTYGVKAEVEKIFFNPFTFEVEISNLQIPTEAADESRLSLGRLYLNFQIFPLLRKEIRLLSFFIGKTDINFTVLSNGQTNWTPKTTEKPTEDKKTDNSKPWTLTLEKIQIENTSMKFSDLTHIQPLELPLGPINLQASNISTSLGSTTNLEKLNISFSDQGSLTIGGTASLKPVSAKVSFKFVKTPLEFLTSLMSDTTLLAVKSGVYDGEGEIEYNSGKIAINSDSVISDFSLVQSETQAAALGWNRLELNKLNFKTSPIKLHITEVVLHKLSGGLTLQKDGRLSSEKYLRPKKSESHSPNTSKTAQKYETKEASEVTIDKLVITDSRLFYADQQIKPKFQANINQLNGTISPVTTALNKNINVNLNGRVEAEGKFKARGYFVSTKRRPELNLKVDFNNIEMTNFTPYSGKFAGYEINKGKLFLGINYILKNNLIKGENKAVLDQFTLGNKVESENATNLPLKLALALLKDREGQIKINLPVEGDVSSPEFSFADLVWTAVKNVIINIAAAPFDFLKNALGGGDNLDSIFFEPGTNIIAADQKEKIQQLAKFLNERPNLVIEIQGRYQPLDSEALKKKTGKKEISEEELKKLAMGREQALQSALALENVEAERLYLLSPILDDKAELPPRSQLNLKSRD